VKRALFFHGAHLRPAAIIASLNEKFCKGGNGKMRRNILARLIFTASLLILALPIVTSAQIYNRNDYDRYNYDRTDRRDVQQAIRQLDISSARLENDLNYGRTRRVFGGIFQFRTVDTSAIDQARDFRRAVRELRMSSRGGFALGDSVDEARMVLDKGVQLDRELRLRTGNGSVDAELAEIRSSLHIIADAYDLRMPY